MADSGDRDPGGAASSRRSPPQRERARLLRAHDFRRVYLAITASELGDSLHYIALMWFALAAGGPLGVIAVRLADSIPAILFGSTAASLPTAGPRSADDRSDTRPRDRARPGRDRRARGHLPIWGLVVASFVLEAATSYFAAAYGAPCPRSSSAERPAGERTRPGDGASASRSAAGRLRPALLTFMPVSVFFAVNAASFAVSRALIARIRERGPRATARGSPRPRRNPRARALGRPRGMRVIALGVAVTISAGPGSPGCPRSCATTSTAAPAPSRS
jgi:hypothetical protein